MVALQVFPSAMDGDAFDTYVENQLVQGMAMILDSLSTRHNPHATATCKVGGRQLSSRPSCSLDLNPIETTFTKLKAHLRRLEAPTIERVI